MALQIRLARQSAGLARYVSDAFHWCLCICHHCCLAVMYLSRSLHDMQEAHVQATRETQQLGPLQELMREYTEVCSSYMWCCYFAIDHVAGILPVLELCYTRCLENHRLQLVAPYMACMAIAALDYVRCRVAMPHVTLCRAHMSLHTIRSPPVHACAAHHSCYCQPFHC